MAVTIIHGSNVIIYQGDSGETPAVAACKSCSISNKCDLIEKASTSQATAKEFIAGRSEAEISMDHLVVSGNEYQGILMVRGTYTLRMVINGITKTMTAICTSADISAPKGGLAKGNIKFKVSGAISTPPSS